MTEFNIAFQKMLVHEGDYFNNPVDSGGETYKGISHSSHSDWLCWPIIDKHKSISGFCQKKSHQQEVFVGLDNMCIDVL